MPIVPALIVPTPYRAQIMSPCRPCTTHHVYTVRCPSPPTRQRHRSPARCCAAKSEQDQDEITLRILRSRSPPRDRSRRCPQPHQAQRVAVEICQDDEEEEEEEAVLRLPDRRYSSRTMQRLVQEQRQQQRQHRPKPPVSTAKDEVSLEDLVEAAFQACERARQLAPRLREAVGAALLCENGEVFVGYSMGKGVACSSLSAERAVLRKALRDGQCPPFQALVLAMDAPPDADAFPAPDVDCLRHFEFVPLFLVNKNLDVHATTSHAVLAASSSSPSASAPKGSSTMRTKTRASAPQPPRPKAPARATSPPPPRATRHGSPRRVVPPPSSLLHRRVPGGPHSWSCAQVLDWLVRVVKLPQYVEDFKNARVDGHTLFHIYSHEKATAGISSPKSYHRLHHYHAFSHSSSALEDTLHVYQPAHKKRLLAEIQKLKHGCVPVVEEAKEKSKAPVRRLVTRRVVVKEAPVEEEAKIEEEEDDTSTLNRRQRTVAALAAAAAQETLPVRQLTSLSSGSPLKQLSRLKKVFDHFAVAVAGAHEGDERTLLLNGTETVEALQALGCTAAREQMQAYLVRRSICPNRHDVSFYEFLRAALALGGGGGAGVGWSKALPATTKAPKPKPTPTPKVKATAPAPPRQRCSSSRSSYSSYSSYSSHCSVSSLSGAEEEEHEESTQVSSAAPPPPPPKAVVAAPMPQQPVPAPPPQSTTTVPPVAATAPLPQPPVLPPPLPRTAVPPIPATTTTTTAVPTARTLAALPVAGMTLPLPDPQQLPLPVPEPKPLPLPVPSQVLGKSTLIPPLAAMKQDRVVEPVVVPEPPVRAPSPPPPPVLAKDQEPQVQLPASQQQQQLRALSRRSVSTSSSSSSSFSTGSSRASSGRRRISTNVQRPSPPSIASLPSTKSSRTPHSKAHDDDSISVLSEMSSVASSASSLLFNVGAKVEARYKGRDRWFSGTVTQVHGGGQAFDIHYDDDDIETNVPAELVRARSTAAPAMISSTSSHAQAASFKVGDRVQARFRGGEVFYGGVVGVVHAEDGTYEIHYDDGDVEEHVAPDLIRAVVG